MIYIGKPGEKPRLVVASADDAEGMKRPGEVEVEEAALADFIIGKNGKSLKRAPVDAQLELVKLRAERNARLAATDWTQLADVPAATQQRWAAYRQALRDLPQGQMPRSASEVIWPVPPSGTAEAGAGITPIEAGGRADA